MFCQKAESTPTLLSFKDINPIVFAPPLFSSLCLEGDFSVLLFRLTSRLLVGCVILLEFDVSTVSTQLRELEGVTASTQLPSFNFPAILGWFLIFQQILWNHKMCILFKQYVIMLGIFKGKTIGDKFMYNVYMLNCYITKLSIL